MRLENRTRLGASPPRVVTRRQLRFRNNGILEGFRRMGRQESDCPSVPINLLAKRGYLGKLWGGDNMRQAGIQDVR
jgi:hypothetical protein